METINDIVADLRGRNQGHPLDGDASHCTVEDILCLADRIEAARKREMDAQNQNVKNTHSEILRLASWIRELTGMSMARERGVAASEVRGIAVKLEVLADNMGVK